MKVTKRRSTTFLFPILIISLLLFATLLAAFANGTVAKSDNTEAVVKNSYGTAATTITGEFSLNQISDKLSFLTANDDIDGFSDMDIKKYIEKLKNGYYFGDNSYYKDKVHHYQHLYVTGTGGIDITFLGVLSLFFSKN